MTRHAPVAGPVAALRVGLNAVIVAVTDEVPRILTVQRHAGEGVDSESRQALPFGPLDPLQDRTLEKALRGWVQEQTGLGLGYVEQLYTFGDPGRDPALEREGRTISVAYLALLRESELAPDVRAQWHDVYEFLPWEDWREGRPAEIDRRLAPALERWVRESPSSQSRQERQERVQIAFGFGPSRWDEERVLDRYELLWEAGLVEEASRDRRSREGDGNHGEAMALDHRRMLATALGRLRGKLKYRPVVFELVPDTFTLLQLQRVVEALAGVRLHKQNFRRLVERGGLVEGTGKFDSQTGGRPAELFRFRRGVLRERPAPGVGIPGVRSP